MLTAVEARVVGALLEKERTVPDQYPLSLQSLLTACNQATAREPVMALGADDVEPAIASLKAQGFARVVHPTHGRGVTKYRQVLVERLELEPPTAAVLAVLLLRGPQTAAELRSRTERLHAFGSLAEVEAALADLAGRDLARLLDRQPGQSAQRWQQLLGEEPEPSAPAGGAGAGGGAAPGGSAAQRIADLEATVAELGERLARLESALGDLLA